MRERVTSGSFRTPHSARLENKEVIELEAANYHPRRHHKRPTKRYRCVKRRGGGTGFRSPGGVPRGCLLTQFRAPARRASTASRSDVRLHAAALVNGAPAIPEFSRVPTRKSCPVTFLRGSGTHYPRHNREWLLCFWYLMLRLGIWEVLETISWLPEQVVGWLPWLYYGCDGRECRTLLFCGSEVIQCLFQFESVPSFNLWSVILRGRQTNFVLSVPQYRQFTLSIQGVNQGYPF